MLQNTWERDAYEFFLGSNTRTSRHIITFLSHKHVHICFWQYKSYKGCSSIQIQIGKAVYRVSRKIYLFHSYFFRDLTSIFNHSLFVDKLDEQQEEQQESKQQHQYETATTRRHVLVLRVCVDEAGALEEGTPEERAGRAGADGRSGRSGGRRWVGVLVVVGGGAAGSRSRLGGDGDA